jgi:hypothetical protein
MMRLQLSGGSKALLMVGVLLVFAALTPAMAGTVTVGLPADTNTGNCFPFGCNYDKYVADGQYQQVYTHSLFSGPITITGLEFYNTQENGHATAMNTGTFTISLSTTAADWNTLGIVAANNIGSNNTQVFSGSLAQAWAFDKTLSITFSTPFTYTPGANANLLLNVVATGTGDDGGVNDISFDTNGYNNDAVNGNTIFGRYHGGTVDHGYGLVTGFDTSTVTNATPEPATFAFLSAGLAGLCLLRKRARR